MSKIKDLLAEEQDIEDLKPLSSVDRALISIKQNIDNDFEDYMRQCASYDWGYNEDGYLDGSISNFQSIVDDYNEVVVYGTIAQLALDLSDDECKELTSKAYQLVEHKADEFECTLVKEAKEEE